MLCSSTYPQKLISPVLNIRREELDDVAMTIKRRSWRISLPKLKSNELLCTWTEVVTTSEKERSKTLIEAFHTPVHWWRGRVVLPCRKFWQVWPRAF